MPPRNFMKNTRPALSGAADALADILTTVAPSIQAADIAVEHIRPNPFQARLTFTDLEGLAQAIRQHGFTSRLRVRRDPTAPGYYQLAFGERRWRAAQLAGLTVIPCDIAEHSDDEMESIGLTENLQRQDLNPLEEAQAFTRMMQRRELSIRGLAEELGLDKDYIGNRLALLAAPPDVQHLVEQRPDTLDAALRLRTIEDPEQRAELIEGVKSGDISSRAVRSIVREHTRSAAADAVSGVQRRITADSQIVAAILRRWEGWLQEDGPAGAGEAIGPRLDELEAQIRALRDLIG